MTRSGNAVFAAFTVIVIGLSLTRTDASPLAYQYCLYECSNCVILWGDELYDGNKCATCCQYSNGVKLDPECKVWVRNKISYSKKDEEYVKRILYQKRSHTLNYNSIFASGATPSYCYEMP